MEQYDSLFYLLALAILVGYGAWSFGKVSFTQISTDPARLLTSTAATHLSMTEEAQDAGDLFDSDRFWEKAEAILGAEQGIQITANAVPGKPSIKRRFTFRAGEPLHDADFHITNKHAKRVSIVDESKARLRVTVDLADVILPLLKIDGSSKAVYRLTNCQILRIEASRDLEKDKANASLSLTGCYVGSLSIGERALRVLSISRCALGTIKAHHEAMAEGTLAMDDRCELVNPKDMQDDFAIQQLRNLRTSAKDRCNEPTDKLVHAWELRLERLMGREHGFMRLANLLYDATSFYGNRPLRAVATLGVLFAFTASFALASHAVAIPSDCGASPTPSGWLSSLCDKGVSGDFSRAFGWTAQAIVNPLAAFSPKAMLVVAAWYYLIPQVAFSLCAIALLAIFILGLRRRFKAN